MRALGLRTALRAPSSLGALAVCVSAGARVMARCLRALAFGARGAPCAGVPPAPRVIDTAFIVAAGAIVGRVRPFFLFSFQLWLYLLLFV